MLVVFRLCIIMFVDRWVWLFLCEVGGVVFLGVGDEEDCSGGIVWS